MRKHIRKTRMRFLPMHPTSSRNGYNLDDRIIYYGSPTTLRTLHEQGLLLAHDRIIKKPTKKGELSLVETQYLATTKPEFGMPQQWVITEEAYKEIHPFNWSDKEEEDETWSSP